MFDITTVRATTTADLLASVALTVGYRPTDSLVVASVRTNHRIGAVARVDLSDVTTEVADTIAVHIANDRAARALVVAYGPDRTVASTMIDVMTCALHGQAVDVDQAVHVDAETYTDLLAEDHAPRPLADVETSAVAAHAVYLGRTINATRADLLPQPARRQDQDAARRAYAAQAAEPDQTRHALATWRLAMSGAVSGPEIYGQMAAMLTNTRVRDAALLTMVQDVDPDVAARTIAGQDDAAAVGRAIATIVDPERAQKPGEAARDGADLLAQIVAHVPDSTPAWTLWALLAWWRGDGGAARDALDRATTGYRLAALIRQAVHAGMPPGWVRRQRDAR